MCFLLFAFPKISSHHHITIEKPACNWGVILDWQNQNRSYWRGKLGDRISLGAPIGGWKCNNFPPFSPFGNYDWQTDRPCPTNWPTNRAIDGLWGSYTSLKVHWKDWPKIFLEIWQWIIIANFNLLIIENSFPILLQFGLWVSGPIGKKEVGGRGRGLNKH